MAALVLKARRTTVARVAWAMVSIALVVRLACVAHAWPTAAYQLTISRFDGLAVGALLALAVRDERWSAWLARRSSLWLVRRCCCSAYARSWITASTGRPQLGDDRPDGARVPVRAHDRVRREAHDARVREQPARVAAAARARRLSYAVYAFHVPIAYYTHDRALAIVGNTVGLPRVGLRIAYAALVLAASVLLALVSGALLERPILRLKSKVA